MVEKDVERALKRGFPLPDEASRESLLQSCLAVLGQGGDAGFEADAEYDAIELDDESLTLLAAAGNVSASVLREGEDAWKS